MEKTFKKCFYQSQLFKRIIEGNPIVLIDIGARGGIAKKWGPLRGSIKAICFEPDESECNRLNETTDDNQEYLPIALFNKKGKTNLYLTRKLACCSLLEPNYSLIERFLGSEDYEVTGITQVNCDTLDNVIRTSDIKDVDFIKIDTQGTELQILQGAENILSRFHVFGVEVEVEFSPLYRNQPLFADVDSFLRERGFTLFDMKIPLGRKLRKTVTNENEYLKGQGLWTYGIYLKDLLSDNSRCPETISSAKAAKTIAIAELHGFGDFALELLDLYLNEGIISNSLCSDIRKMLLFEKALRERKLGPELKLYLNIRRDIGEFLNNRFPLIYNYLVKRFRKS